MAKVTANQFLPKGTTKRKGVHAKSKTSKNVNSKKVFFMVSILIIN